MKPLAIIKVGDTFPMLAKERGDFEHWIAAGLGQMALPVTVIDPRNGCGLPAAIDIAGAVVTGSHAMVSDRAPWSEALAFWLCKLVLHEIPVLGICYGHQLLAHAMGGEVGYRPGGIEIGTITVQKTVHAAQDVLLSELPQEFAAHVVHRQSVRRLPRNAILLAGNRFEPHQAYRIGEVAWGVQFHPEFSHAAMTGYIDALAGDLQRDGCDLASLRERVTATRDAASILQRFGAVVEERQRCFA